MSEPLSEHTVVGVSGERRSLPLHALGGVFLLIGATAFGGLGAALTIIERELVERRSVLTHDELTEALTYTKLLPGSTVVQVVSYVGYKLGGWPGSALATAAFVLPSVLAMLALAAAYVATTELPLLASAIHGLTAAVVGVLLATLYRLGTSTIKGRAGLVIAVIAFGAGAFLSVNAALLVVAGGVLGIPLFAAAPAREKGKEGRG